MEHAAILTNKDYLQSMETLLNSISFKMRQSLANILGLVSLLDEEENIADIIQIMQFMKEPAQELNQCVAAITDFMQHHRHEA